MFKLFLFIGFTLISQSVFAAQCTRLNIKPNSIITVKSALLMGTRLQLPANLISEPLVSNQELWDVEGVVGTNQIVIKPNTNQQNGKETMIFAYADNGQAYDIRVVRVSGQSNQACVIINPDKKYFNQTTSQQLQSFVANNSSGSNNNNAQLIQLRQQMVSMQQSFNDQKQKAIVDALKKYRYHIYTRYTWNEGNDFIGKNTVSDVYDDGRFTYIRLANPNKGILSVTTEIGGKDAIAPVKYDDAYGIYRLTGIYPTFTLKVDNVKINVTRTDNKSNGAS